MRVVVMAGVTALAGCFAAAALAQGQDSTAAERNLRIMAEMLPGIYDNSTLSGETWERPASIEWINPD